MEGRFTDVARGSYLRGVADLTKAKEQTSECYYLMSEMKVMALNERPKRGRKSAARARGGPGIFVQRDPSGVVDKGGRLSS